MLKHFAKLASLLLLLGLLTATAVVTFINPTKFKYALQKQVAEATGQRVDIQGPVRWHFFPVLCLEVQQVSLKGTDPFSQDLVFAERLQFFPRLGSFLLGKFLFDVKASSLVCHLNRLPCGTPNWQPLINLGHAKSRAFLFSHFTLENGSIYFQDNLRNQHYHFSDVEFSMTPLIRAMRQQPTEIKLAFTMEAPKPADRIKANIKTTLKQLKERSFELNAEVLKVGSVDLERFKTFLTFKKNVITMAPIEFQFASGVHKGNLQIDYREQQPRLNLVYVGEKLDIRSLLETLGISSPIEGRGQVKANLSTLGYNEKQWRQNLNGQAEIQVDQGNLLGIDLLYLLKHAQSTLKSLIFATHHKQPIELSQVVEREIKEWQRQAQAEHPFLTPFETIKATAIISGGVINSPDLFLQHPKYHLGGIGTIDIRKKVLQLQTTVRYQEQASNVPEKMALFLKETPLNIQIQGDLHNPVVKPDLETYTQFVREASQKNLLEHALVNETFSEVNNEES